MVATAVQEHTDWVLVLDWVTRGMQYEHKGNTLSDAVSFLLCLHTEHKGNTLSDAVPFLLVLHMEHKGSALECEGCSQSVP